MIIISFSFFTNNLIYSQPEIGQAEVLIRNHSGSDSGKVTVKVSPVGLVFSGCYRYINTIDSLDHKYSLKKTYPDRTSHWPVYPLDSNLQFITGGIKTIRLNDYGLLDFDDGFYFNENDTDNARVFGGISYGLWKFEFWDFNGELIEECFIDYRDFNISTQEGYPSPDIILELVRRPNSTRDSLVFNFESSGGSVVNINDYRIIDKNIKIWHRVGTIIGGIPDPVLNGGPNKGPFKTYVTDTTFLTYPIRCTEFGGFHHLNPTLCELNLLIDKNGTKIRNSDSLNFKNAYLEIKANRTFTLGNNSKLTFDGANSFLKLNQNSKILLGVNASIELKYGAN